MRVIDEPWNELAQEPPPARGRPGGRPSDDEAPNGDGTALLVRRWASRPRCVGLAREELRRDLVNWGQGELSDQAELVLSELFTNAVRHAQVPWDRLIETRFERLAGGVRIEVHDADETRPVVKEPSMDDEWGRGLALVDALTGGCWGVSGRAGVGKLLWAVVAGDSSAGGSAGGDTMGEMGRD